MKRMVTRKPFSKIKGLTLLETMFALAVGALVLIGAVIFYISTKTSATTSKVVGDMNSIVAATDTYIVGGQGLTTLGSNSISVLQTAGLVPNPFYDPWGQEYTATVSKNGAASTTTITIPGITGTDSNCQAIVSAVSNAQGVVSAASGDTCAFTYPL